MSILAVGSVAFDNIVTPSGRADNVLGGSATYFSLAASYFTDSRNSSRESRKNTKTRNSYSSGIYIPTCRRRFDWNFPTSDLPAATL